MLTQKAEKSRKKKIVWGGRLKILGGPKSLVSKKMLLRTKSLGYQTFGGQICWECRIGTECVCYRDVEAVAVARTPFGVCKILKGNI